MQGLLHRSWFHRLVPVIFLGLWLGLPLMVETEFTLLSGGGLPTVGQLVDVLGNVTRTPYIFYGLILTALVAAVEGAVLRKRELSGFPRWAPGISVILSIAAASILFFMYSTFGQSWEFQQIIPVGCEPYGCPRIVSGPTFQDTIVIYFLYSGLASILAVGASIFLFVRPRTYSFIGAVTVQGTAFLLLIVWDQLWWYNRISPTFFSNLLWAAFGFTLGSMLTLFTGLSAIRPGKIDILSLPAPGGGKNT